MAHGKGGRKTAVDDPAIVKQLLDEIRLGASNKDACLMTGISPEALMSWVRKGEAQKQGKYRKFLNLLMRARAERRKSYKVQIQKAALDRKLGNKFIAGDWRATAFLATVVEKEEFGPRVHVIIEDQLRAAIDRLKKEFHAPNEVEILERALSAISGEVRYGRAEDSEESQSVAFTGISEEPDSPPAVEPPVGVPGTDV